MRKVYLLILLICIFLLAGCSNNGDMVFEDMIHGHVQGDLELTKAPLIERKLLLNDMVTYTDSKGEFHTLLPENDSTQSIGNNDLITIKTEGFNEYETNNWKNNSIVNLRPYLAVVRYWNDHQNTYIYHHNFFYILSRDYQPAEADYLSIRHDQSGEEFQLVYQETEWGEKRYVNEDYSIANFEEMKPGQWIIEGIINGEDISKNFEVELFDSSLSYHPEITDYEIKDNSILIDYEIPYEVEGAYVVVEREGFHNRFYKIDNLAEKQVEVPFDAVDIENVAGESYNWSIQTVNLAGLNYGFEIRGNSQNISFPWEDNSLINAYLESNGIPLVDRKILVNDNVAYTDSQGNFETTVNNSSSTESSNLIIVETEGFNEYETNNWKNNSIVNLRPYLRVVRYWNDHQNTYIYHHNFSYTLSRDYQPAAADHLSIRHDQSGEEFQLVYQKTEWGEKRYVNEDYGIANLEEMKPGQWIIEGIINGEDISKNFEVELFDSSLSYHPEITDYEIKDNSILIDYEIPYEVEGAYVVVEREGFHNRFYKIDNLAEKQVEVPFDAVDIENVAGESYNWFIQTVNLAGLNYSFEINGEAEFITF